MSQRTKKTSNSDSLSRISTSGDSITSHATFGARFKVMGKCFATECCSHRSSQKSRQSRGSVDPKPKASFEQGLEIQQFAWRVIMEREARYSQKYVMKIVVGSEHDKKTALERIDQAFPMSDDNSIRDRITQLVLASQTHHGDPWRLGIGSVETTSRYYLKQRIGNFIVHHLPESVSLTPRKEDSPLKSHERLEELEASARGFGWFVEQGYTAVESPRGEQTDTVECST